MTDKTEPRRRIIKFWAPTYRSRALHKSIHERAEELGLSGEMRWDIGCGNEAEFEGTPDKLDEFEQFVKEKVDENAVDHDDWRSEQKEATGEFDGVKTLFSSHDRVGDSVIPEWVNKLNQNEEEEN